MSEDEEYDSPMSEDDAMDEYNSEETTLIPTEKPGFSSSKLSIFSNHTAVTNQEKNDIQLSFSEWDPAEQLISKLDMDSEVINTLLLDNGDLKFVVTLTKEQYDFIQSQESELNKQVFN